MSDELRHPRPDTEWLYATPSGMGISFFVGESHFITVSLRTGREIQAYTIVRSDWGRRVCIRGGRFSLS